MMTQTDLKNVILTRPVAKSWQPIGTPRLAAGGFGTSSVFPMVSPQALESAQDHLEHDYQENQIAEPQENQIAGPIVSLLEEKRSPSPPA